MEEKEKKPNMESDKAKPAPAEAKSTAPEKDTGRKKRKKWVIAIVSVVVVLGLLVGAGYGVFHHYSSLMGRLESHDPVPPDFGDLPNEDEDEPSQPPLSEDDVSKLEDELRKNLEQMEADSDLYKTDAFNILLIGVDSRSDAMTGRSDCMILTSINKKTKQVTMTSFLRDIYCSIPGYGSNRLNAAYAFGGTELLKDTIKKNFGISVDRCLVVNFYLVMDLVDAVGGIDLDLTADEIGVMNKYYINAQNRLLGQPEGTDILSTENAGTIHVNGNQALAYARVRYIGTDFARTGRQRTVISKCLDKVKKMGLGEISSLAEEFLPRVRTDLTEGDCAALLLMALNLNDYAFESLAVPVDGSWNSANINGMSVLTINFSENAKAWHDLVDGGNAD